MQVGFLGALAGELRYAGHGLALALAFLDLVLKNVGHILLMDMEVVVDLALDEVADVFVNRFSARFHERGAELDLCLRLEYRLLYINGDGRHDAVAYVGVFVVFVVVFLDGLCDMLLEGALMGAALRGVLAVDKAVILLAILIGVGEGNLYILALDMDDGV